METIVQLSYVFQHGNWDLFCEEQGIDYWACANGFGETKITLTQDEAKRYGLLKED